MNFTIHLLKLEEKKKRKRKWRCLYKACRLQHAGTRDTGTTLRQWSFNQSCEMTRSFLQIRLHLQAEAWKSPHALSKLWAQVRATRHTHTLTNTPHKHTTQTYYTQPNQIFPPQTLLSLLVCHLYQPYPKTGAQKPNSRLRQDIVSVQWVMYVHFTKSSAAEATDSPE